MKTEWQQLQTNEKQNPRFPDHQSGKKLTKMQDHSEVNTASGKNTPYLHPQGLPGSLSKCLSQRGKQVEQNKTWYQE